MKHTKGDLQQMQSLPLSAKIQMTKRRIRDWYEYWDGQVYISFSGGKDSAVLLHIAREIYPDIEAVFINTGLEYPEIQRQYEYCIGGGEYVNGVWQPSKEGLGMGHVFDELNKIYGDGFIKY